MAGRRGSGGFRHSVQLCSFRYKGPSVRLKDTGGALTWAKENAPLLVTAETVEKIEGDAFRAEAERIRKETGELLPGVEFSEGGDSFSLSFPSDVKPKKPKP